MSKSSMYEIEEIHTIVKNKVSGTYSVVFTISHDNAKHTFMIQTISASIENIVFSKYKLLEYITSNKASLTRVDSTAELISFYTDADLNKDNKDNKITITDDAYIATDHVHYLVTKGNCTMVKDGIMLNFGTKQTPDMDIMEFTLDNPVIKFISGDVFCYIYKIKDIYEIILSKSKTEVSGE